MPKPKSVPSTPVTLSLKDWMSDSSLQIQLRAQLETPVMRSALQTLLMQALPSATPDTLVPGVSAEAMSLADANRYHNRSGFASFYKALQAMANPPAKAKTSVAKELVPEDE